MLKYKVESGNNHTQAKEDKVMKFIKSPCTWFAAVLLFTFVIGPAYLAITDKAEKRVVKMNGCEKIVFVEWDKTSIRYDVPGGGAYLYEKDGKVMRRTTYMPIRRPTLFITTSATADETITYRQIFAKKA